MSLRVKIAASMAVLVLIATSAVGVISYRSTSNRLVDEVDRSIVGVTTILAMNNSVRGGLQQRGLFAVYSIRVVDRTGRITSSTFEADSPLGDDAASVVGVEGGYDRSTAVIDGERFRLHTVGGLAGAVQVGRSLGETDNVLRDVRNRTLWFVLVVSLAAAVAGWLLASTVAAPLRRLTRAATDVEESGDLDIALPESGNDEVGRLASAFSSMLGALSRSRGEQRRLVQDAGHELRTPLTSLRTNLAVLRRHPDMADEMRDRVLDDLDGEVSELTDLVNELVTVASGDLADQPAQDVDLAAIVNATAARVMRRRDREIRVDAAAAGVVFAPLAGVERAVINLLENAAKFDTSGGEIVVTVTGGKVTVSDSGPGIPTDDLPLVFDRFHRSTTARTLPGSGLGLAIVREIVERHGGTVHAANRPDGGAAVGFELPMIDFSPPS